jgi:hemolysin activation/secretion protein
MVPPVGMNRLSLAVFYDVGAAWESSASRHYYQSAGLELLAELRVGYLLGAQFRLGYAQAFEAPGGKVGYLRVGRSF